MDIKEKAEKIVLSEAPKDKKIKLLCNLVREIPYKRIGSLDPEDMIKFGKGSCTPKHVFLAIYLKRLGIPVKFLTIPFFYKKLKLKYPKDKMNIVSNMPIAYHVALKAKVNSEWLIIDVTWDSKLKKMGFVTNDNWDGKSDMRFGVVPEKIIEKDIDPRNFEKKELTKYTKQEVAARKEFYSLMDNLIENSRK